MTEPVLAETKAAELRQLGIKVFSDITTILHHAQSTTTNPRTSTTTNPQIPYPMPQSAHL